MGGDVRSPVTNGQLNAVARGNCAVAGQRSALAGHAPTAASHQWRLRRGRFITGHGRQRYASRVRSAAACRRCVEVAASTVRKQSDR
jgi:hypothetical protein